MDLNLKGRRALVCGASRGLGHACAQSLAREGVEIFAVSRRPDILEKTVQALRQESGTTVHAIAADITDSDARQNVLHQCGPLDILVTNAGGPPAGGLLSHDLDTWRTALNANMLSAIDLIRSVAEGMMERRFGRIVNIASAVLKAPDDILALSNGARAGLIAAVSGFSRTAVRHNVTINSILPGPFATDRLNSLMETIARNTGTTAEEALRKREQGNPSGRIGAPEEFGDLCAYLCSSQAGFITGQSLLIDGGEYRGLF